jgi:hypothetical protein
MYSRFLAIVVVAMLAACSQSEPGDAPESGSLSLAQYEPFEGFLDLYWDADGGRLLIKVEELDTPLLYQSSMARGVGSNDLGLDRGQLAAGRVVRFLRSGPKVLLVEDNLLYRAVSDDADERQAVAESFGRSVIWGFEVADEANGALLLDATAFFTRDAVGLAARLERAGEGSYAVDASRSAIYLPRTKAFPDNSEIEAIVTYAGDPTGPHLPTVVPDASLVTVHLHHSFIRLPDDAYVPLPYNPRAGVIGFNYGSGAFADYATPIGEELNVRYGRRHRLEKVNPAAEVSEAVEPIIYYLDRGAPEPVRSALLEGASWWNQAFEAAGYKDAFQVQLLPEGADPMDVRYNVIQWVHRSTRGWSYGASILDPRTGEILKGHVSLGSLRVRQDYLIAEGLLAPYDDETVPPEMLEMSLARIRQLAAHEVGHTIGFEHNFAASTQDRASVMDYPVPLIKFDADGEFDLSDAYDDEIGSWDKRTVLYSYQDFADDIDARAARREILDQTLALGYAFVADGDSRSIASAHPDGNLWDNGKDSVAELEHLLKVRAHALQRFSERNIRFDRPLATIEEVLVPIYLLHRFQIQAVGKLIGGSNFTYAQRGDGQVAVEAVAADRQQQAIDAIVATLATEVLQLPEGLAEKIPPRPPGYPKSRETFSSATGVVFDPLAPAASAAVLSVDVLFEPTRAARMQRSAAPGFDAVIDGLLAATWYADNLGGEAAAIQRQTSMIVLNRMLQLAVNGAADAAVRATTLDAVNQLDEWLAGRSVDDRTLRGHYSLARYHINRMRTDPASVEALLSVSPPPGGPIG